MNSAEDAFIQQLRTIAVHPAARGLADDAAVLGDLVLTHDMIVEGVHFLASDPPADVAWKLVGVNLSDLAAKGATPVGCLLGIGMAGDGAWAEAFATGLGAALSRYDLPLLGGDTVAMPAGAPRTFGLTAIGKADIAPPRSGAKPGDMLYVTGSIGDAGLGLALLKAGKASPKTAISAYRRPVPLLAQGRALAPVVNAMMDVSDGLLLDAQRMATASGLALTLDLDAVPLSQVVRASGMTAIAAATAGDDYQLLFAAAPGARLPVSATAIGRFAKGDGLSLTEGGRAVPLPQSLGYLHG
jgi:thiamine-monophosphate kinase